MASLVYEREIGGSEVIFPFERGKEQSREEGEMAQTKLG